MSDRFAEMTRIQVVSRRRFAQLAGVATAGALAGPRARPVLARQNAAGTPATGENPFGPPQQQGGTYTVALAGVGSPRIFVPTSYYGTTAFFVCKLLYTPLVVLDRSWENLGPAIASDWEWSADNTQLTMRLRNDVVFHDGKPLTARDVEFTMKLMVRTDRSPAVRDLSLFQGGTEYSEGTTDEFPGVDVVDDHTVRFNLTSPSNLFLLYLSDCGILPSHAFPPESLTVGGQIEQLAFFNEQPIGTGPFMFQDYNPETFLSLQANPRYHKGVPNLDGITLRFGVAGPAAVAGVQAGEFDGVFVGPSYQDARVLSEDENLEILVNHSMANEQTLWFSIEKPYLSVPVRQALLTALDIETIIETLSFGYARPAPSVMMHPSLFPNPNLPTYPYDPARARELLTQGRWPAEHTLKFGQFTTQGNPDSFIAAIMDMWNDVGVKTEFLPLDSAAYIDLVYADDHVYDVAIGGYAWLAYDPSSNYTLLSCGFETNDTNYCNPEFDAAMLQAIRTPDPAEATALYQKAQTIIQTELPYGPLWIEPEIWAISKRMHGGVLGRGPLNDILSELWWKE